MAVLLAGAAAGCGSSTSSSDAGATGTDAGVTTDAGAMNQDAGNATDAGTNKPDAGSNVDAGTSVDAGSSTDAGTTVDAGLVDAGSTDGGASTDAGDMDAGSTIITIKSFAFSPQNLTVPAGASIGVVNADTGVPHSVTSESAENKFDGAGVNGVTFDTGSFTGGSEMKTITIPANATSGTVIPFYCKIHTTMMPQGTITIQ